VERMEPRRQHRLARAAIRVPSGAQRWVRDLNALYRSEPALYETDFMPEGWRWIDADDSDDSVLTYMRLPKDQTAPLVMACNFTPIPRPGYRVGVPHAG